jgi:hypothetical protein
MGGAVAVRPAVGQSAPCGDCGGTGGMLDDGSMTGRAGAPIACPCTGFWQAAPFGDEFSRRRVSDPDPMGWWA